MTPYSIPDFLDSKQLLGVFSGCQIVDHPAFLGNDARNAPIYGNNNIGIMGVGGDIDVTVHLQSAPFVCTSSISASINESPRLEVLVAYY